MSVEYLARLTARLEGIQEVRPTTGWSTVKQCRLKRRCLKCRKLQNWEEASVGFCVPKKKRRDTNRIYKCADCRRTGKLFIHEFHGAPDQDSIMVMSFHSEGLEPEEGYFYASCDFVAVDVNGNISEPFKLGLDGHRAGNNVEVVFDKPAAYSRSVGGVRVAFESIRRGQK